MQRIRRLRRIWIVIGLAALLALAAAAFGLQREGAGQGGQPAIGLNAPTGFPVDI